MFQSLSPPRFHLSCDREFDIKRLIQADPSYIWRFFLSFAWKCSPIPTPFCRSLPSWSNNQSPPLSPKPNSFSPLSTHPGLRNLYGFPRLQLRNLARQIWFWDSKHRLWGFLCFPPLFELVFTFLFRFFPKL